MIYNNKGSRIIEYSHAIIFSYYVFFVFSYSPFVLVQKCDIILLQYFRKILECDSVL